MRSIDMQLQDDADLSFAHRKLQQEIAFVESQRILADKGYIVFDDGQGDFDLVYNASRWPLVPGECPTSHDSWADSFAVEAVTA